ncbi:MAG: hypothetical protein HYS26_03195 [Candidatus Kaiserbacteria bacterium]|nr:MAG: hypothetical protein HYS26_03195 [Candidatus Kaiserbacteria bacterium]
MLQTRSIPEPPKLEEMCIRLRKFLESADVEPHKALETVESIKQSVRPSPTGELAKMGLKPDMFLDGLRSYHIPLLSRMTGKLARPSYVYFEIAVLVDGCGCSYRWCAQKLGIPLGTVRSRLHRARKALNA